MNKTRLEAFSDAVIAIVMTVMVLELRVPQGGDLQALRPLVPTLLAYVLSFVYLAIYWNNHHHMLQAARTVNGKVLWANMLLLFWLSLIPFGTSWMGEHHEEPLPTAVYGFVLLMCGVSYSILVRKLTKHTGGDNELLAKAIGADFKGWLSVVLYLLGIGFAFLQPTISHVIYAAVAVMWFIPDRRIERRIAGERV
jgi:uncharacterized membrane protein